MSYPDVKTPFHRRGRSARIPTAPSARALTDVVLSSLRNPRLGQAQAARLGLAPEALTRLVERFVSAGVGALVEDPPFSSWLQLGVSFKPLRREKSALLARSRFGEALRRAVVRWQERGLIARFFFMNKPPGMRLRFETTPGAPAPALLELTQSWLLGQPAVVRVERTIYLAEEFQFGGAMGASAAHDYHAADSLLALKVHDREQRGVISASSEILSLLVVCDLVRRMTDDAWEAWDFWKRMEITGRRRNAGRELTREMVELVRPFVLEPDSVLRRLAPADRALIRSAYANNERAALDMRRLAADGQLLFHLREIIPFWIIFHWNRWAVENQGALTLGIEGTYNPKR
jgi:thiopeptide-type bacteriocin biosynthesis protein